MKTLQEKITKMVSMDGIDDNFLKFDPKFHSERGGQ